jgi:hypothetical protein
LSFLSASCGRKYLSAGAQRDLHGSKSDAACRCVNEHTISGLQVCQMVQAVVSR